MARNVHCNMLMYSHLQLTTVVPAELGNLTSLTHLYLHSNDLTGPIPVELSNLTSLTLLLLSGNDLTGPIPVELSNLTSLTHLYLDGNDLTGPIPAELGNLTSLTHLYLFSNDLTGPIPVELSNLTSLTHLYLYSNDLTGPIPAELGNLTSLTHLYLFINDLTGPIPAQLGNLTSLAVLALYQNNLTGHIPAQLGNLTNLTDLHLDDNELTGPIPAELGHLVNLEYVDFENNGLRGSIPAEFGRITSLQRLQLTNNAGLAGALPPELTALTRLEEFLAGGTGLCLPTELLAWAEGIVRRRIARCEWDPPMAYLTQAAQSMEFPVPLVAGEEALLRVFPIARQATNQGMPAVRAVFYLNGRQVHVANIDATSVPIPDRLDQSDLSRSANAVIPEQVIQPGLEMVIEIDPEGTLDPGLGVPTRIPESGRLSVDVQTVPLLDLTLIPFLLSGDPDSSVVELVGDIAADPANHEMLQYTRMLLPVADLEVTAHEPVLTTAEDIFAILLETGIIRIMEGGTGHYQGMTGQPLAGREVVTFLPPGRSSVFAAIPRNQARGLAVNMGLRSVSCDDTRTGFYNFPHAYGSIGVWGYDFRDGGRLVLPSTPDLMSLCDPPAFWISDYHFTNALRFRVNDYDQPALSDRAGQGTQERTLLVWGGVGVDSVPFLEPVFVMDAPASLPEAAGDHRITGRTADGGELFSLSFAMLEVVGSDGSSGFAFAVPVQSSWGGTLATITLSGPGGSVTLDADSDRAVAILRNPRTGQVRGILRGASARNAAQAFEEAVSSVGPELEVIISRGVPDSGAWRR